ncbi:MAG: zf-HC2 domain-containing protein [Terriglobales bacterium]
MTEDRTEKTTHEQWTGQLDAYLEGELDSGQMQELDRHLRECSGCTAEALRRLQWKRAIRSAGQGYVADPAVRERIRRSISPAKPAWWQWRPAFAVTAALLLVLAGARIIQLETVQPKRHLAEEGRIAGELADLHVATLASANPVDVVSSDRHSVKPWFAGKIPFSFNLPEFQGSQFELVGGRVSYLEQSPGAQLLFRVRKHQISVFIFQVKALPLGFASAVEMDARSFHLERWQHDGLQYFAISDAAPEDLRALSDLLGK